MSPSARVERSFLIQCLVLPQEGRAALATLDLELDILTPVYRRAALLLMDKLGGQIQAPAGDEELASTLAELQVRAARATASRAALEAERLRLELASLERRIQSARSGGGGNVVELARRREELQSLMERELEETLLQTKHTGLSAAGPAARSWTVPSRRPHRLRSGDEESELDARRCPCRPARGAHHGDRGPAWAVGLGLVAGFLVVVLTVGLRD